MSGKKILNTFFSQNSSLISAAWHTHIWVSFLRLPSSSGRGSRGVLFTEVVRHREITMT